MNESIAKFVGGLIGVGGGGDLGARWWWLGGGIFTGTSLVVSRKVTATFGNFDFFSQKTPDFENSS